MNLKIKFLIKGFVFLSTLGYSFAGINWDENWAFACDFEGNDLTNEPSSGEDCGGKCANTNECTHFTWTTYNGGTCWMKKNGASKNDAKFTGDNTMVCGVIQQTPNSGSIVWNQNWAFECDFDGNDLANEQSSGQDCGGKCANTNGCTHFTWTTFNGGTCWMKKNGASKSDAKYTGDKTMVCGVNNPDGGGSTKPNQNQILISRTEFNNALTKNNYPNPSDAQYNSFVSQIQSVGGITTKREVAMFLTHIMWESDGLQAKVEYACVNGCQGKYDTGLWPSSYGCSYHGRGYVQLSWDYNYLEFSKTIFGDDRLLKDPEPVATDEKLSWSSAFWFWKKFVGNLDQVKQGHFGASTNAINGNLECKGQFQDKARKRFEIYKIVLQQLNIFETPNETGCYN